MGSGAMGEFWRRNEGWGLKEKGIRYSRNATMARNSGVRACMPAKFYLGVTKNGKEWWGI